MPWQPIDIIGIQPSGGRTLRICRLTIENVRSFLDRREILFDGAISILIGPNGGGKTNLLDTLVIMLRRHVFNTPYFRPNPTTEDPDRWEETYNDQLNNLIFEKHSQGATRDQIVELELEVAEDDVANMYDIQNGAVAVRNASRRKIYSDPWQGVPEWKIADVRPGASVTVRWKNGGLEGQTSEWAKHFLQYLHVFETDNTFRAEAGMAPLRLPMVYLPVNRASSGFGSSVGLSGYNDYEQKRATDATSSRNSPSLIALAVGRLARKYRLLQEDSNVSVKDVFYKDPNLVQLSADLKGLNYSWELVTVDALTNTYDVRLTKQGSSFLVSAASSGERELLTYLFAIHALNVKNALIVVDEPELHLHPRWQSALFALFERLSQTTGNQFILATHSPTFISPASIQYVSRVFSEQQKSNIVRLNSTELPDAKHLFSVVNSQNNERVFFTDKVVLVEGLSDRIVFEKVLEIVARKHGIEGIPSLEVISIGGKGLFPAYQRLLDACHVKWAAIADRDYIEQIGNADVKKLFVLDTQEIKKDVIDNIKSLDGAALVGRISDAIDSGDWQDAQDLWAYIKSRRIRLQDNLTAEQDKILDAFISEKEAEGTYLLRRGDLENYLPEGHKGKDMEKLITLVSADDFWEQLPENPRADLQHVAIALLGIKETANDVLEPKDFPEPDFDPTDEDVPGS